MQARPARRGSLRPHCRRLRAVHPVLLHLARRARTAPHLDQLGRAAIRAGLAELADRLEPGTVRTRYKGLCRFCRWLHAESEIDVEPMDKMGVPKVVDKPVPTVTGDDLAKIIKRCAGRGFDGRRDEALVRFLLDTGCRVSELCGIDELGLDRETALVLS